MIIQSTSPSFGSTETFGPPCIQKGGMAPHDANQQRSADEQRQENPWALLEEDRWRLYNEVRTAADGKSYSWPEFQAWYGTAAKQEWARAGASTPADIDPDTRAGASTPAHIHPDALKVWSTVWSRARAVKLARRALTREWAEYREKQALLDEDTMEFKIRETLRGWQDATEYGPALAEVHSDLRAAAEAIGQDRAELKQRTAEFHKQQLALDERKEAVKSPRLTFPST